MRFLQFIAIPISVSTLNLSGLGSVTVYGKPQNRNVSVDGLGKVSWK